MRRHFLIAALIVVAAACSGGGGSESSGPTESELITKLEAGGLKVDRLDGMLSQEQRDKLPTEPKSMFSARISDAHGNTEPMTFVELNNEEDATEAATYQNGFAVGNWFVVGIVSNHMKHHVEGALR